MASEQPERIPSLSTDDIDMLPGVPDHAVTRPRWVAFELQSCGTLFFLSLHPSAPSHNMPTKSVPPGDASCLSQAAGPDPYSLEASLQYLAIDAGAGAHGSHEAFAHKWIQIGRKMPSLSVRERRISRSLTPARSLSLTNTAWSSSPAGAYFVAT